MMMNTGGDSDDDAWYDQAAGALGPRLPIQSHAAAEEPSATATASWLRPSLLSGTPSKAGRKSDLVKKEVSTAASELRALQAETSATEAAARLNRSKQQAAESRLKKATNEGIWQGPPKKQRIRAKSPGKPEEAVTPQKSKPGEAVTERDTPAKTEEAKTEEATKKKGVPSSEAKTEEATKKKGVPSSEAVAGVGAAAKGGKGKGKAKGPPQGTFAGRRPPKVEDTEAYEMWTLRKSGYDTALKDLRAAYPGKQLKMPSANQMKYWDFMKKYIQEHGPKGCTVAETRAAMASGSQAYKDTLRKEAEETLREAASNTPNAELSLISE